MSKSLGTVASWEAASGIGSVAADRGGEKYPISRRDLADASRGLEVGQRVVFELRYERLDAEWHWTVSAIRVVAEAEAAAIELEDLCRAYEAAVEDSSLASEVASEDDEASAQHRVVRAAEAERTRIPEIGVAVHAHGGTSQMVDVLMLVAPEYRREVSLLWSGIGGWTGTEIH